MLQCNHCGAVFSSNCSHQCIYTNLPLLAQKVIELEKRIKQMEDGSIKEEPSDGQTNRQDD